MLLTTDSMVDMENMIGKRVEIKAGDERGGWGIVKLVSGKEIHVALYGGENDVRVFSRREIRIEGSRA